MGYMKRIATERMWNPPLTGGDETHKVMRETVRRLDAERTESQEDTGPEAARRRLVPGGEIFDAED